LADFEVYVDDDRYEVPSFYLISAASAARAKVLAEELWRSSAHHRGVELLSDGVRLAAMGSMAEPASDGCARA